MREFPARESKAAIGAPNKIQHPCENLVRANLVEVVEVSSLCLGWRDRFETQERSIGLGSACVRSHTWPGLVLLGAEGLGMSCEMLFLGFRASAECAHQLPATLSRRAGRGPRQRLSKESKKCISSHHIAL